MLSDAYLDVPPIRANFVQGANGRLADEAGSSRGISNPTDLQRLLELRVLSDILVTDGKTARLEQYKIPKSTDLAVITRRGYTPRASVSSHRYLELRQSPEAAIGHLIELGYQRILLELGPKVFAEIVKAGIPVELCLTNTGGSDPQLDKLGIGSAELVFQETHGDTRFTIWRQIQSL